jgi:hypothetical protein
MPQTSYPTLFDYPNNMKRRLQIIKPIVMRYALLYTLLLFTLSLAYVQRFSLTHSYL